MLLTREDRVLLDAGAAPAGASAQRRRRGSNTRFPPILRALPLGAAMVPMPNRWWATTTETMPLAAAASQLLAAAFQAARLRATPVLHKYLLPSQSLARTTSDEDAATWSSVVAFQAAHHQVAPVLHTHLQPSSSPARTASDEDAATWSSDPVTPATVDLLIRHGACPVVLR
jgi:hypothetical protein